jgi:succinyl-CoA synthetase beta subunit
MSVAEAVKAAEAKTLPGPLYVVKAQIHAGGRGAGKFKNNPTGKGGVRLCKICLDEVKAAAEAMMNQVLVTKQTGPEGKEVQRLYVTDGVDIKKEYYCSVVLDRATSHASPSSSRPRAAWISKKSRTSTRRKSIKVAIDPAAGFPGPFHARTLAFGLGLSRAMHNKSGAEILRGAL